MSPKRKPKHVLARVNLVPKPVYTLAEVQKLMGETILAEREACAAELRRPQAHRWHLTPTECAEILLNRSRP